MLISGSCYRDNYNFMNVFTSDRIYTIAPTGDWGCVPVGGTTATGHELTEADYNRLQADCTGFGEFELEL